MISYAFIVHYRFFVLRNDDNVISKSLCKHDVIGTVTYIV